MKRYGWIVILTVAISIFLAGKVSAQQATPASPSDDDVNRIAKQLYCPVCQNTPLDVCPTQACAQWRALIRQQLAAGWTDDQIKQYFVQQYGVRVLGEPPAQGLNWLVYVVPPALFLAGSFILYFAFRSMRKPIIAPATVPPEKSENDTNYFQRVEEELRKRN